MSKDWVRMWCMAFEDLALVKVNVEYMRGQIHYHMSELLKLLWVHVSTHLLVSTPKNWRPSLSHWNDYLWRPSASHRQGRWLRTKFDQVLLIFPRLLFHTLTLQATAQPVRGKVNFWPFSHFECKFLIYFLDKMGAKIVTCSKQVWWRSCQQGRQWEHRQGSAWGISKLKGGAEKTVARRSRG